MKLGHRVWTLGWVLALGVGLNACKHSGWHDHTNHHAKPELKMVAEATGSTSIEGTWQAPREWFERDGSDQQAVVSVEKADHPMRQGLREYWNNSDFKRRSPTDSGFVISALPGSITFTDTADDDAKTRSGTFTVALNASLGETYANITGPLPQRSALRLILRGLDADYLDELSQGGTTLTWEQVEKLYTAGVSPQYLRAIRKARATPVPQPVDLTGAPEPQPLPEFTTDDIVYLSTRNVSAEYVKALQEAGYGLNAQRITYLHQRGVSATYAGDLREAGYDLSPEGVYYLHSRGIQASYAKAMREAGYDLNREDLYYLNSRRVSAKYAKALREAGYDLSKTQLYYLHSRGISADYAARMASANHEPLSPEQLYHLHSRGVDPDLVQALRTQPKR